MGVVCKLRCVKIEQADGQEGGTVRLSPVTGHGGEENQAFWKYTPSGTFEFNTINPEAFHQFELGREFRVTLEPLPRSTTLKNRLAAVDEQLPAAREKARLNPTQSWSTEPLANLEKERADLTGRIRDLEARGD